MTCSSVCICSDVGCGIWRDPDAAATAAAASALMDASGCAGCCAGAGWMPGVDGAGMPSAAIAPGVAGTGVLGAVAGIGVLAPPITPGVTSPSATAAPACFSCYCPTLLQKLAKTQRMTDCSYCKVLDELNSLSFSDGCNYGEFSISRC